MYEYALAYDAGLFDGEGSVFLNKNALRKHGWSYVVRCSMTLTDLRALERLHDRWGGSLTHRGVYSKLGKRPCWAWSVTGRRAEVFLRAILPYLQIKQREAEAALLWDGQDGEGWQEHMRQIREVPRV